MNINLSSGDKSVDIAYTFEPGDSRNKLPLNRVFLKVELHNGSILIENEWDLLSTVSSTKVTSTADNVNNIILNNKPYTQMVKVNNLKYIVLNKYAKEYNLCIIWCVDNNNVDFIYEDKINSKFKQFMVTDTLIERYGASVLRR